MKLCLLEWDGKSTSELEVIYKRYNATDDFVILLLGHSTQENIQMGATWLLKHHLETGHEITQNVIYLLAQQSAWQAKLHLLQCLSYLKIDKPESEFLYRFLKTSLKDDHKFVRAWAYNGLYELANQYPFYMPEVIVILEIALVDEAPSIRARIRNILKKIN